MPYLCEKLKGNSENFHSKKNYFVSKKFWKKFFENFLKIFFALNPFLGWFIAKKKFQKILEKIFDPKNIWNFFSNENFYYFLLIFCQGKAIL